MNKDEQKRTTIEAILKLPPSKELSGIYDKLQVAEDEWSILYLSAKVADIIVEYKYTRNRKRK